MLIIKKEVTEKFQNEIAIYDFCNLNLSISSSFSYDHYDFHDGYYYYLLKHQITRIA